MSEEEAGGLEAAGGLLEPGLELDGACATADDNINPLSAVVINRFFNIGKPPCMWVLGDERHRARFFVRGLKNTGPLFSNV
ncbi:MAG TPA: hypothetical protein VFK79_03480 [Xanthobacteraceae bacterium]|nr:hypothetical protein [Xanthobacteraceae bacterium]